MEEGCLKDTIVADKNKLMNKKMLQFIVTWIVAGRWRFYSRLQVALCAVKQFTVTWPATWWLAPRTLQFSLTDRAMGHETVYLCYDFLEVLQNWPDSMANETFLKTRSIEPRRRIQDVRPCIFVTNCVHLKAHTTWKMSRLCQLMALSLQWLHNERDGVSNHQPHDCLLRRLFRRRSKKTSKIRVTGLCAGNSPGTGEFPA